MSKLAYNKSLNPTRESQAAFLQARTARGLAHRYTERSEIELSDLKDIANILFFVTMSLIAVLSYIQARKTVFAPIKTEVFKLQIEAFRDVIAAFNRQGQSSFDEFFEFHQLFQFNAERMQRAYMNTFFHKEIEITNSICDSIDSPPCNMIIDHEDLTAVIDENDSGCCNLLRETEYVPDIKDPALKLAYWNSYKLRGVHYNTTCNEKIEEIRLLAASPVLPQDVTDLMYEFIGDVHHNISLIKEVVEECAKEMTEKYPTADAILQFQVDWMWNIYNHRRRNLETTSNRILAFVNGYLKANEIMK